MSIETKTCPECEKTIAANEIICPSCSFDFEALDEKTLATLEKGLSVIEKRKAKKEAENKPAPAPAPVPEKKRSFFDALKGGK